MSLVLLAAAVALWRPADADAAACPEADPTHTSTCGPLFQLPMWGDGNGWDEVSRYGTIQLADVDGDGRDELLGRGADGLQIQWFDTSVGQWRPQVDARQNRQAITDFRSPWSDGRGVDWTQPEYASTIQAADVDGRPGEEVLARFPDGMRVYRYRPPNGGGIDGGTWSAISTGGPFSDAAGWTDPSLYQSVHADHLEGLDEPAVLWSRSSDPREPIVAYAFFFGRWSKVDTRFEVSTCGGNAPQCYLNLEVAERFTQPALIGRTGAGVDGWVLEDPLRLRDEWYALPGGALSGASAVFADRGGPDCPFANTAGNTSDGSGQCLASAPSYYETLQLGDVDGDGLEELLARANDGLRVKRYDPGTGWRALPTLTDLAGSAAAWEGARTPGRWASIQTADIDGRPGEEVLALDANGLQAWSYDARGGAWRRLQPSTPLSLGGDPWLTQPEYYATLQSGDVDGDGRDEVIGRSPTGIRTWFYDRRGTGGWERYFPDNPPGTASYQPFPTTGQQAAFTALNAAAQTGGVVTGDDDTVRDVWTGENAPSQAQLSQLQNGILRLTTCTGGVGTQNAAPYAACTPPSTTGSYSAADWTAVINQILAEIGSVGIVLDHFDDVSDTSAAQFTSKSATLPALGTQLRVAQAAANQADFDFGSAFDTIFNLLGSVAGLAQPEIGAALQVTGDLIGLLPSSSPAADARLRTTWDGLTATYAQSVEQMGKSIAAHSQTVRTDGGLLALVAQLRQRGTWQLNEDALTSAANQGFSLWAYRALLPTIYARYEVTGCVSGQSYPNTDCVGPSNAAGVIGGGTQNFTTLAGHPWRPRGPGYRLPCDSVEDTCRYSQPEATLANVVWGRPAATCDYVLGNPNTVWTFGCSLGVDPARSVGENADGWRFDTYTGAPDTYGDSAVRTSPSLSVGGGAAPAARLTAGAARADESAAPSAARAGRVRFRGRFTARRGCG